MTMMWKSKSANFDSIVSMNLGKAAINFAWLLCMLAPREITKRKSILPLQPGGVASPTSLSEPTSRIRVVLLPPALVSEFVVDVVLEAEVEPLWPPLELLVSPCIASEVDAGVVVIAGIVVKPDVSVCDGWQASVSPRARKLGRDRGRMRTKIAEV